jgi:flagellar hook-associated protein 2
VAISAPGAGSNLDVNSIITQLMALERRPLTVLNQKEASYKAKISALGSLKSSLSALKTAASALVPSGLQTATEKLAANKTSVGDATLLAASADSTAVAGTYSLAGSQLAKAQRLTSPANPAIANGTLTIDIGSYDEPPTAFTAKTGTSPVNITIDDSNNTVEGVRDAINEASAGVTATVVNGSGGKFLILESTSSGTANAMRIGGSTGILYDASNPGGNTVGETVAAKNALLKVNGIDVSSDTNSVTTAVGGLTLTLLDEPDTPSPPADPLSTTVTVSKDNATISAALETLIKAYNDSRKSIRDLGAYNQATRVGAVLNGDSVLRVASGQLQNVVNTPPSGLSGDYQSLSSIGISVGTDGSLSLNSTKLDAALAADFTGVANLVAATGTAFKTAADNLIGIDGTLTSRSAGIDSSVRALASQRDAIELRMTRIEARLRRQYASLDSLISGFNNTSSFLQRQLG